MSAKRPLCLVTGVGPGTGTAIARRFAVEGFRIALNARNADRIARLADDLPDAFAVPADLSCAEGRERLVEAVLGEGVPEVVVNNAVGGTFGDFLAIDPAALRHNFAVNVEAVLDLARGLVPAMIDAGGGSFLATGNTSAYRGKAGFAGFAPTKAAQRILLESIAPSVGPRGVHVGYVAIDAVIDLDWTRTMAPDKPDEFFCRPDDIAAEVFRLSRQPRSAWSFDSVIRPFGESW